MWFNESVSNVWPTNGEDARYKLGLGPLNLHISFVVDDRTFAALKVTRWLVLVQLNPKKDSTF